MELWHGHMLRRGSQPAAGPLLFSFLTLEKREWTFHHAILPLGFHVLGHVGVEQLDSLLLLALQQRIGGLGRDVVTLLHSATDIVSYAESSLKQKSSSLGSTHLVSDNCRLGFSDEEGDGDDASEERSQQVGLRETRQGREITEN